MATNNPINKLSPISIVEGREAIAAAASKLIADNLRHSSVGTREDMASMATSGGIEGISHRIGDTISANKDMLEIFPELGLHAQILASNILAPKDMLTVTFIYGLKDSCLPQEVEKKIIYTIKRHLDNHYRLRSTAGKVLEKIILTDGADIKLIIPEAALDKFINSRGSGFRATLEGVDDFSRGSAASTAEPLGFLPISDAQVATMEGMKPDYGVKAIDKEHGLISPHTVLTDNYTFMTRQVPAKIRAKIATEDIISKRSGQVHTTEGSASVYKRVSRSYEPMVEIGASGLRESVGRPLYIGIPPESMVVIHRPGSPDKRVGGIIVVNEEGFPITKEMMRQDISDIEASGVTRSSSMGKYLSTAAKEHAFGKDECIGFKEATDLYSAIEGRAILERFRTSIFGENVALGVSNDDGIFQVMLARAIKNSRSRLVFVPEELMSYLALDYYDNGIGRSVMDKLQQINGLRATLLMANVTREVRNSIPLTKVKMDTDPKDPDVFKTIQRGRLLALSTQSSPMPTSAKNFNDYAKWASTAGMYFEYGGHPKLPDVKFDFQTSTANIPNNEVQSLDKLGNQATMAFGLTPEMVEESYRADFASSYKSRNAMLAKRSLLNQEIIMDGYSDRGSKICRCDMLISRPCREAIKDNLKDILAFQKKSDRPELNMPEGITDEEAVEIVWSRVIHELTISLPSPDVGADAEMARDFSDYRSALEDIVPSWVAKDSISGSVSELSTEALETGIIEYFLRKWALTNGYMPELFDIPLEPTELDTGILADIAAYAENMARSAKDLNKKLNDVSAEVATATTSAKELDTGTPTRPGDDTSVGDDTVTDDDGVDNADSVGDDNDLVDPGDGELDVDVGKEV